MQTQENYNILVESENEPQKFKILWSEKTDKGIFYLVRFFWQTTASGKPLAVAVFNLILLVFMPVFAVLDLLMIIVFLLWLALKQISKNLWELILKLTEKMFTKIVFPTVKIALQLTVIITLIIILIYKFNFIKEMILKTFDSLIK